jgi:Na+/H+ antiporter NhaD/arsenite permease-like protein
MTSRDIRKSNGFTFGAIAEVAALFFGIFLTMTAPMEYLRDMGSQLGLHHPAGYFWASGTLSSFLDNAPTYLVFFTLAQAWTNVGAGVDPMHVMQVGSGAILTPLLVAISVGSVFMGANTYIGNGPNFMVKKIAEEAGVKMPGFFGYMLYSICILIPLFVLITLIFFR